MVQKGGLDFTQADKARVEQFIRGATEADMLLLRLSLREQKSHPPTLLQLLNEIREEEEQDAARHKLCIPVRKQQDRTAKIGQDVNSGLPSLRDEIKDLKLMVRELSTSARSTPTALLNGNSITPPKKSSSADQHNEMQAQEQVQELQTQLTALAVKSAKELK